MRFECPHCQQPIEADDECAGMATNCPTCTENIVVPADAVITTQEVQLSPEADQFLAAACAEYDGKQQALDQDKWRLTSCMEWGFDDTTGAVTVRFEDGSAWEADGQFLGSFNPDDKTFQWAWDSPDMSEHLTRDSRLVKAIGERFGLRYLLMGGGCFPLP